MKAKLFLLAVVTLLVATVEGQTKYTHLIAWLNDGHGVVCYGLADQPTISMEGTDVVLTTTKESVSYQWGAIERFTVGDGEVAMGVIALKEARPDEVMSIYDVAGKLVASGRAGERGDLRLGLQGLPAGVYVVKVGNVSLKIVKR